ncbi:hypothetical protein ABZP36_011328 [Zizania latifolia]
MNYGTFMFVSSMVWASGCPGTETILRGRYSNVKMPLGSPLLQYPCSSEYLTNSPLEIHLQSVGVFHCFCVETAHQQCSCYLVIYCSKDDIITCSMINALSL